MKTSTKIFFFLIIFSTNVIGQVFHIYYPDLKYYKKDTCYSQRDLGPNVFYTCYNEREIKTLKSGKYIIYGTDSSTVNKILIIKSGKLIEQTNHHVTKISWAGRYFEDFETLKKGKVIKRIHIVGDTLAEHVIFYYSDFRLCKLEKGDFNGFMFQDKDMYYPDKIVYYYNSKLIKKVCFYKNCKRTGKWQDWDEKGKLKQIITYRNGEIIKSQLYNKDGELIQNKSYH